MELAGKRVLVVGLGRTGVATAEFLLRRGARVTVSELRPEAELPVAAAALRSLGARVECGGDRADAFEQAELIIPSPGVPLTLPEFMVARRRGIELMSELEFAGRFLRGIVVAVTGSNGKTTTTALLGKIFGASGRSTQVGGNIGTPLVGLVDTSAEDTVHIVEVSSFQLEAISSFHPRVAVLLNITPDHLDRHVSLADYIAAKARLFAYQTSADAAILNADDPLSAGLADQVRARRFAFSRQHPVETGAFVSNGDIIFAQGGAREKLFPRTTIRLKGDHNLENVLAAVAAARVLEVPPGVISSAVAAFAGVEHRLEFVARLDEVDYYNDSKATNVDAALKAIAAFPDSLLIILGGKDKGADFQPLAEPLRHRCRRALLIGAAAEKIRRQLADSVPCERIETLPQAVARARALARPGDTVLLAPACASFDQFENFEHRGRVFKEEVRRIEQSVRSSRSRHQRTAAGGGD